jgi:hypothetical protein
MYKSYPVLRSLCQEASAFHLIEKTSGRKVKLVVSDDLYDVTKYDPDPEFCWQQKFDSPKQARGEIGLKQQAETCIPKQHLETALQMIRLCGRPCNHPEDEEIIWHLDAVGEITNERCTDAACYERNDSPKHFVEVVEYHHKRQYDVPPETTKPGRYSLSRKNVCWVCGAECDGVMSLAESLKHAAGETPHPERLLTDGWHTPDGKVINDLKEPLFVVRSCEEGHALSVRLSIIDRWRAGKLSRWYVEHAFYVVDATTREALLDMNLTKATVTGPLGWKPVVLTFADAEVERKLAQVCKRVVTVLPVEGRDYLAEVSASLLDIKEAAVIISDDLPAEALDGWLGEVCRERLKDFPRAYAWPSLLTAASVLVGKELLPPNIRANIFTGLIGPVGSGKTCVFNEAFRLLGLKDKAMAPVAENEVIRLKAGSGEGLASRIGDQGGASKLVFVDELEHLLKKVNIKGSAFANTLDDAYTTDAQEAVVANRVHIPLHVRLSLAGGIPEEGFSEAFGAGTVGGLHSRFLFGVCPSNYPGYCWIPPQGSPALERRNEIVEGEETPFSGDSSSRPSRIEIDPSVWTEKVRWQRELKLHGRAVEIALKAAIISACFDRRGTLTADQLGPALAFARYQDAVHRRFEPNPGKTDDACFENDVKKYLHDRASEGVWISRKKMLDGINAYRYGSGVTNRVLAAMSQNRIIELSKEGRTHVLRLVLDKH